MVGTQVEKPLAMIVVQQNIPAGMAAVHEMTVTHRVFDAQ